MTNEQQQVKTWMQQFGQECPDKPVVPSLEIRKLRAKLILEEAIETIEALGYRTVPMIDSLGIMQGFVLEEKGPANLSLIVDGCEDLKVVTEGTLIACGLVKESETYIDENGNDFFEEIDPLFNEVMRSNFSKLWTAMEVDKEKNLHAPHKSPLTFTFIPDTGNDRQWLVKDKDGKVIKSPSYSPAKLNV